MASVAAINNLGGYALNPRGNLWFHDESTFGHKLLLKMGWNKGKGLGKNEDGIKENLKVKVRSTNSGLGFKDDAYANVMKTEYESILKNLSAEYSQQNATNINKKIGELNKVSEQKSRVIKSKLRYPKLFFGKDVTKYSEDDMKSIFICSIPLKDTKDKDEDTTCHKKEIDKSFDTISSTLSVSDYFTKKMNEKKSNLQKKDFCNADSQHQTNMNSEILETDIPTNSNTSLKRKRKHLEVDINEGSIYIQDTQKCASEFVGSDNKNATLSRKKLSKKKKRNSETNIDEIEVDSIYINENDEIEPKKCNARKTKPVVVYESGVSNNNDNIFENKKVPNDDSFPPNKKKKTLPKNEQSLVNSPTMVSEGTSNFEIESITPNKMKKNKKHRTTNLLENKTCRTNKKKKLLQSSKEVNSHPSESVDDLSSDNIDHSKNVKKSKKLRQKLKSCLKNRKDSYLIKNVSFNETVSYRVIDSEFEFIDSLECNQTLDQEKTPDEIAIVYESNSGDNVCPEKMTFHEKNENEKSRTEDPEKNEKGNSFTDDQKNVSESDENYAIASLPSSKSCHYNSWIESQRQAMKMQMYKKNVKKYKKA